MIAIDLRKLQTLDVDPKAIQQINFIGSQEESAKIFLITEEVKETILEY